MAVTNHHIRIDRISLLRLISTQHDLDKGINSLRRHWQRQKHYKQTDNNAFDQNAASFSERAAEQILSPATRS